MFTIIVLSLLLHFKIFYMYLSPYYVSSNTEPNQHGPLLNLLLSVCSLGEWWTITLPANLNGCRLVMGWKAFSML